MIEILRSTTWIRLTTVSGEGGIVGQVTHCRLNGTEFYVRENTDIDTFYVSSNERWGMHTGRSCARRHAQVLDLCCPRNEFDRIASAVRLADHLKRPVRPNRLFTTRWAQEQFNRDKTRIPGPQPLL
jgi:hypothetical protein